MPEAIIMCLSRNCGHVCLIAKQVDKKGHNQSMTGRRTQTHTHTHSLNTLSVH